MLVIEILGASGGFDAGGILPRITTVSYIPLMCLIVGRLLVSLRMYIIDECIIRTFDCTMHSRYEFDDRMRWPEGPTGTLWWR